MKENRQGLEAPIPNTIDLTLYLRPKVKCCIRCSVTRGVRRYSFVLFSQVKVFLCVGCIHELNGSANAIAWLERNIEFPKKLIRIKRIKQILEVGALT